MGIFLSVLLFSVMAILGAVIGAYGVGQLMILFRFAIPQCKMLRAKGELTSDIPRKRYRNSAIFLFLILVVATLLVLVYGNTVALVGYFLGVAVTGLPGLSSSTAYNTDNVQEFMSVNAGYFKKQA